MARVCVFDVNETLLDLGGLDLEFTRVFGTPALRQAWFTQLLQSAMVSTITGSYSTFGRIGASALDMIAARQGIELREADRQAILAGMRRLPPHADVHAGLQRLRDAGIRLAALTNSTLEVAEEQLRNAGLTAYFEQILSADTVRRLKPAPEPYHMAADRLAVEPSMVRLVAAHAWDVTGALRAGCAAAFVGRPGQVLDPLVPRPDVVGSNMREVVDQILFCEQVAPFSA
ncbi:MAG: haloacid dehalogenase, type [Chloroflexi bacterium]|jgi:2-haloacid dehalogenase|nr:haloacid dehalogenase, type [Chloroflexota bacterium]